MIPLVRLMETRAGRAAAVGTAIRRRRAPRNNRVRHYTRLMKSLALERESSTAVEAHAPRLESEPRRVLEVFQDESLRETSFRLEEPRAVIVLELIPLRSCSGLTRLFRERGGGKEETGSEYDRLESS